MRPSNRMGRREGLVTTHRYNQAFLTILADLAGSTGGVVCSVSPSTEGWRTVRVEISAGSRTVLVLEDNGELVHCGPEVGYPVPLGPVDPQGALRFVLGKLGRA